MKTIGKLFILIAFMTLFASCNTDNERIKESFNSDWLFMKGELGEEASPEFDDATWRKLDLPHDWAIEGPFDPEYDARTGGLPISGIAWYRKSFSLDQKHKGKIICLEFDGVMNNAEVFINGKKVAERPYGYMGFEADLTPHLKFGEENIVAVKVAPEELSSRWYPGAGIYRNVWMEIKDPLHIAPYGVFITTPEIMEDHSRVIVETKLRNTTGQKVALQLKTSVIDTSGNVLATEKGKVQLPGDSYVSISQDIEIIDPNLWELENPYLYTARLELLKNGSVIDTYESSFGIRSIEYSAEQGFLLNGKKVKFKGVCLHHDLGPLGAAVNYRATERQLQIMKQAGVNAIRTSHNPPSPEQLELCDKMGLLVQVEAFDSWKEGKVENGYNKYWDNWYETDLRDMVKRDRNHPSVVMWSIGNEIREQKLKSGGALAAHLVDICHEEDPTRPVTAGFNSYPQCIKNGLADAVDLVGFNYKPTQYDTVLDQYPDWLVYGAETSSCVSSRGVYHLPVENYDRHHSLQVTSYDIISPPWAYPPDFETYAQETMPRSLGEFVWTGFDYLGEPTPYNGRDHETHGKWGGDWPSRSSYFGIVDLCGFPKDRFYYYQSIWTEEPMVHILPHWNWEDSEQKVIPVYCYTNCDEAELFLNGRSLGKKVMGVDKTSIPADFLWWKRPETTWESPYRLHWNVEYEPGELKVVAYTDGKIMAEKVVCTAGNPFRISLHPDRSVIKADGYDLSFVTVRVEDENGNLCPMADNLISFKIDGPAEIAAVGNGNAATTESFIADYRKAFNGQCLLVLRSKNKEAGQIDVKATAENLQEAQLELHSH